MSSTKVDLSREPSHLVCIDTNLWLGNFIAATDAQLLREKEVKFILTVNSFPLPKKIAGLSYVNTTKYIKVSDTPRDDLLSHFEETYEFIECAVKKGVVLVHCHHGVSRSPTIVMAYLMKKESITMEAALRHVKSKQESIGPNIGFVAQLRLYEIMCCSLDKSNVQYKMFRLYTAVGHVEKEGILNCWNDIIKADPLAARGKAISAVYKCKKCRRIVAQDSNIIPHAPMEKYNKLRWSECLGKTDACRLTYFVEPLAWMRNVSASLEGKLHCPNEKCNNKLGSFSWVTESRCSCGTYFCPGFYLIPSKVDKQIISQK